ncbi:hypothetical protein MMPV_002317 [Pyropia vietnamensis]
MWVAAAAGGDRFGWGVVAAFVADGIAVSGIDEDDGDTGDRRAGASVCEDDDSGGGDRRDDNTGGGGGGGGKAAAGSAAVSVASVVAAGMAAASTAADGDTRGTAMGVTHPSSPPRCPHTGDLRRGNERLSAAVATARREETAVGWETRGPPTPGGRLPVVAPAVACLSNDDDTSLLWGEHSVALLRDGVPATDAAVWGWGGVRVDGEVMMVETSPPRRRLGIAVPVRGWPSWDGVVGEGRSRATADPSSRRTDEGIVRVSPPAPPTPAAAAPPPPPLLRSPTQPSPSPLRPILPPPRRARPLETPCRADDPSDDCRGGTAVRNPANGATTRRRGISDDNAAAGKAAVATPAVEPLGVVVGVASALGVAGNVVMKGTAAGRVTRRTTTPVGVCVGSGGDGGSDCDSEGGPPGGAVVGTPVGAPPSVSLGVPPGDPFRVSCGWQVPAGQPISRPVAPPVASTLQSASVVLVVWALADASALRVALPVTFPPAAAVSRSVTSALPAVSLSRVISPPPVAPPWVLWPPRTDGDRVSLAAPADGIDGTPSTVAVATTRVRISIDVAAANHPVGVAAAAVVFAAAVTASGAAAAAEVAGVTGAMDLGGVGSSSRLARGVAPRMMAVGAPVTPSAAVTVTGPCAPFR